MTDQAPLVERLRHPIYAVPRGGGSLELRDDAARADMNEAADQLERRDGVIEKLRADLLAAEKTVRAWHRTALAMRDMSITWRSTEIDDFYIRAAMSLPVYGADPDPTPSQRAALAQG